MTAASSNAQFQSNILEFDHAVKIASEGGRGAYIEVVTDKYAVPPLPLKLHENLKTLYQT